MQEENHEKFLSTEGLTFDDVLLVPQYSEILPHQADTRARLTRNINLNIPLVSAAMDTVTEADMAIAIAREGGIGVIHRNLSAQDQVGEIRKVKRAAKDLLVASAIGVGEEGAGRARLCREAGADVIVLDTAHGYSKGVLETLTLLKNTMPNLDVIAGNVVTPRAAHALAEAGADAIKVGVGPGSICTTRVVTGAGFPQITAIMESAKAVREFGIPIIADGGIKYSGDITKAIAAGADAVMIGGLLAGAAESPGERIILEGRAYKIYRGMGSEGAMIQRASRERYGQQEMPEPAPEGVEGRVPYKGTIKEIVYQFTGGLRAGMAYCGARTLKDLQQNGKFLKITPSSLLESHPHNVTITKEPKNYSS